MTASARRDLFISINGSIDGLTSALKAGRSVLLDYNSAAGSIIEQVEKKFAEIGSGATAGIAETERNLKASFDRIRANARAVLESDGGSGALKIIDAAGAQQAADVATQRAAQLRLVAESAQRAEAADEAGAQAVRAYATAAAIAAVEADKYAQGLRQQAGVLGLVEIEAKKAGATQGLVADEVVGAHGRMGASGMILQHVVRSTTDSFVAGLPPAMIFGEQIGRLGEAAALSGGAFGKFGEIMSGPWGLALVGGIAVLSQLIPKLLEGNDAVATGVEKLKEDAAQTEATRLAREVFRNTIEGEIDAQRRLNDELDRSILTQRQLQQATLHSAQTNLGKLQDDRPGLVAQIANLERGVQALRDARNAPLGALVGPVSGPNGIAVIAQAEAALAAAKKQLISLDASIANGARAVNEAQAPLIERDVEASLDKRTAATERYTIALGNLRAQLAVGAGNRQSVPQLQPNGTFSDRTVVGISPQVYETELKKLEARHKAELKAIADAEAAARRDNRDPSTSSAALLSSAEQYRGDSESGAGRGSLLTLFSQAGIHIDPAMTAWCAAFVNAVLATNGLKGTGSNAARSFLDYGSATNSPQKGDIVVLRRGNGTEGHVGFFEGFDKGGNVRVLGGNQGPPGFGKVSEATYTRAEVLGYRRAPASAQSQETSAESAAKKAEEDRIREVDRVKAYQDEMARATADNIRAQLSLNKGTEDQLAIQLDQIAAEKVKLDADVDAQVAANKLKPAEAAKLKTLYRDTELLQGEAAVREDYQKTLDKQLQASRDEIAVQSSYLDLQLSLATTQKARFAIAMKLLDLDEAARREQAERLLKSDDKDERAKGQRQLNQITAESALRHRQANQQYAGPLEQYRQQLQDAAGDMDTALQNIAVHGLGELNDGLDEAAKKALGLHGIFGDIIGDFIKLAAQRAELALLDQLFPGSGGGESTGSGGGGGIGGIVTTVLSLFGHKDGLVPGFASGHVDGNGIIRGPGTGTSDSILAFMGGRGLIRVSNRESIMTEQATSRFGPWLKAMNDNSLPGFAGGLVPTSYPALPSAASLAPAAAARPIHFDLRGAVMTPDLLRQMQEIANETGGQVYEASVAHTDNRLGQVTRRRL